MSADACNPGNVYTCHANFHQSVSQCAVAAELLVSLKPVSTAERYAELLSGQLGRHSGTVAMVGSNR